MRNRIPSPGKEGRMLITPENGGKPFYATVTMADEPLEEGTPLAQESLLSDATAEAAGLIPAGATPEQIFSKLAPYFQHWWKKVSALDAQIYVEQQTTAEETQALYSRGQGPRGTIRYSKEVYVNKETGEVSLVNPLEIYVMTESGNWAWLNDNLQELFSQTPFYAQGRTAHVPGSTTEVTYGDILYVPAGATLEESFSISSWRIAPNPNADIPVRAVTSTLVAVPAGTPTVEHSVNRNAYPDYGKTEDGVFRYLGIPLDLAITGAKIATGSYVGSGAYGAANPNSVSPGFEPFLLFVFSDGAGTAPTILSALADDPKVTYDGVDFKWYSTASAADQNNTNQKPYHYVALGL